MRIGLLGTPDRFDVPLEQPEEVTGSAADLVRAAGHEPVALDLTVRDLHRVGAVWVHDDPGELWRLGAPLLGDMSIALDRGMPLLLTGGLVAATETGLLPGTVTPGRGGRRTARVVSAQSSWTASAPGGVQTSLAVDQSRARWAVEEDERFRVVARWDDVDRWDVAALASVDGNVVGLLGDLDSPEGDATGWSWLSDPVAMRDATPLEPVVEH
ncbi:hypothetical protein GCM10027596_09320 [Nocardioides korecus]